MSGLGLLFKSSVHRVLFCGLCLLASALLPITLQGCGDNNKDSGPTPAPASSGGIKEGAVVSPSVNNTTTTSPAPGTDVTTTSPAPTTEGDVTTTTGTPGPNPDKKSADIDEDNEVTRKETAEEAKADQENKQTFVDGLMPVQSVDAHSNYQGPKNSNVDAGMYATVVVDSNSMVNAASHAVVSAGANSIVIAGDRCVVLHRGVTEDGPAYTRSGKAVVQCGISCNVSAPVGTLVKVGENSRVNNVLYEKGFEGPAPEADTLQV